MPCIEMQELEARNDSFNDLSHVTVSLMSAGRHEFRKWHRAGRARIAYIMQTHRKSCKECRCHN
jgi:hypothetical protein